MSAQQESFLPPSAVARVLLDGAGELIFDYLVPDQFVLEIGMRVQVPVQNRLVLATVLELLDDNNSQYKLKPIKKIVSEDALLTAKLMKLAKWIGKYYHAPLDQVIKTMLPSSLRAEKSKDKILKKVFLLKALPDEEKEKLKKKAPKQFEVIEQLELLGENGEFLSQLSAASVKALEKKEIVKVVDETVNREPDKGEKFVSTKPLKLNEEQENAFHGVLEACKSDSPKPILLAGVTGSGKTEVYLQAADAVLSAGRNVIILVPEIALTPQTVRRFKSRFAQLNHSVAVLHSDLSEGERHDEWKRLRKGEAQVAIGARSAIYAPLENVGLIIVDEEHETSYKQESSPRYQARDVSIVRANLEKCPVVLGSATPSLESWNNALSGKFELIKIDQRADGQSLPLIRVVDMRTESRKQKMRPLIFSDQLRTAIEKRLEIKEQVILFLNRRGFARNAQCPNCGHVVECPHCALSLTYHRKEERMICHLCHYKAITPRKCPSCADPSILFQGFGTEKVEEITKMVFPKAIVKRLDADITRKKGALKETLEEFRQHKIDILIGTQMIAKGLHFPSVTLVGVLNADLSLHTPDFRAGERTFQLLTQVAGRSGRGPLEGEVVIQTFTPHAPSIQYARHHDFAGFAEQELEFRKAFEYPPYSHLAVITTASQKEDLAEFTLKNIHQRLKKEKPESVYVGEPLPSPLTKSHDEFRFQLIIRSAEPRLLSNYLNYILKKTPAPKEVRITCDLDAYEMA